MLVFVVFMQQLPFNGFGALVQHLPLRRFDANTQQLHTWKFQLLKNYIIAADNSLFGIDENEHDNTESVHETTNTQRQVEEEVISMFNLLSQGHDNTQIIRELLYLQRANIKTAWLHLFDGKLEEAIDMCDKALLKNFCILEMSRTNGGVVCATKLYILHVCMIPSKIKCMCGMLSKKLICADKLYHNKCPNKLMVPFKEEALYENFFVLVGKGYMSNNMTDNSVISGLDWMPKIKKMVWFGKPINSSPVFIINKLYKDFK